MLVLSRLRGESLILTCPGGTTIKVTITDFRGDKCRIGITAPREIVVLREELLEGDRAGAGRAGGEGRCQ